MVGTLDSNILRIVSILKENPSSINEISKKAKLNWRTAKGYLDLLKQLDLVMDADIKRSKLFFYKDANNYFNLPVKKRDGKIISTIYHYIKKFNMDIYGNEPSKTQVYKIIWHVNGKFKLDLPIGWYKYGPCCVQAYKGGEKILADLSPRMLSEIKETTRDYCSCDKFALQERIYEETNERLYLAKTRLIKSDKLSKKDIHPILLDLIKFAPSESVDVVTDFARASLLIGWEKTGVIFEKLWAYLATIRFKQSLAFYYGYIDYYLEKAIEDSRKEVQIEVTDLIRCGLK